MKTRINGIITLKSPLHIASPESARYSFEQRQFTYSDKETPCTRVIRGKVAKQGGNEEEGMTAPYVPNIPANSIRGGLRRRIAHLVFDALGGEHKVNLPTYLTLMNGADSGSPNKAGMTQEEVKNAKEHPIFGLLGGTRRMFRSTLITETANQVSPAAISVGAVPEKYKGISFPENESGQVIMFRRVDDALTFNDPEAQNVIENYEDAMKTWIEGTSDSKKKRKAAKDAGEDVKGGAKIDTWSCMEVIIPGVSFYFNIEVDSEYEYHGAIVAMGLEKLINQQSLGGWTRNGMGRFNVHDVQISRGDKSAELFVYEGEDVKLNTQDDFVAGVVKSGQDALNSLTKENLEEIVSVAAGGK